MEEAEKDVDIASLKAFAAGQRGGGSSSLKANIKQWLRRNVRDFEKGPGALGGTQANRDKFYCNSERDRPLLEKRC